MKKTPVYIAILLACQTTNLYANNTNYGVNAGTNLAAGSSNNTLFGAYSGNAITDGDQNSIFGSDAGRVNTASGNTFMGYQSGYANTTATDNTFVGFRSGYSNTTGVDNTFIGDTAGYTNTTGMDNVFVGNRAGYYLESGHRNVGVGQGSLLSIRTGINNTAVGDNAGSGIKTGSGNAFFGNASGYYIAGGVANTSIGAFAGLRNVNSNFNTFVGSAAGYYTGRISYETTGTRNTAIGTVANYYNDNGADNVSIGAFSGTGDLTRSDFDQLALDLGAPVSSYSVSFNGLSSSGLRDDVNRATRIGTFASSNADDTIAIGYAARTTASSSMVIGASASGSHANAITIGYQATSHGNNIVVLGNDTTASWDPNIDAVTSLGGINYRFSNFYTTSGNIIGGSDSNAELNIWADSGSEDSDKWSLVAADSGDFSIASLATGSAVDLVSIGNTGDMTVAGDLVVNSDARLKTNIQPIENALAIVDKLQGKSYHWKEELKRDTRKKLGFIAQEVEKVLPELVTNNKGNIKSVNYQGVVPVLVNAVNELSQKVSSQEKETALLKQEIELLKQQLEIQRQLLAKLNNAE